MANAFSKNGFDALDVTMNSLISKENNLDEFQGIVFCGGFSYGDVLGAGSCLLYTSPSPRDATLSRMPSSA